MWNYYTAVHRIICKDKYSFPQKNQVFHHLKLIFSFIYDIQLHVYLHHLLNPFIKNRIHSCSHLRYGILNLEIICWFCSSRFKIHLCSHLWWDSQLWNLNLSEFIKIFITEKLMFRKLMVLELIIFCITQGWFLPI